MYNRRHMQTIVDKLQRAWELAPECRLCQLVSNLHGVGPQDIYYTEDATFEEALDDFLTHYEKSHENKN